MNILGISAYYHDSAAAILQDGELIAAAQEERFSRIKFDHRFPRASVDFCLKEANITYKDVDYIVFYEKPLPKFQRILLTHLHTFPRSWRHFREAMLAWFGNKMWVKGDLMAQFPDFPSDKLLFVDHHMSHAASAAFCAPFEDMAVLTLDGVGEWTSTAMGTATGDFQTGANNALDLTEEIRFPHSLGLLYSVFTAWLGFKVNSGEYKVMGMAPYGNPRYMDKLEKIFFQHSDGSFTLNMEYFSFHESLTDAYNSKFCALFGPPREPESPFFTESTGDDIRGREEAAKLNQYYADVAASLQLMTENAILNMANALQRKTGKKNLVMAGGVALNSVANGRVMRESTFEQVYIQPNAGDAGGALGAALYAYHVLLKKPRKHVMTHAYYGQKFSAAEEKASLDKAGLAYEQIEPVEKMAERAVDAILKGQVIALFQGRFEWGPRALGNRSIMADPRKHEMQEVVNTKIKFRESFRPFAPVVTEERADEFFDMGRSANQLPQRFMLQVAPIPEEKHAIIPAVCHMGTGRLQTVDYASNPLYYEIVRQFGEATGVPILMNTSLNLRGEPLVTTPENAFYTYGVSDLDVLILDSFFVTKKK
jgi:carbamoyltransferase